MARMVDGENPAKGLAMVFKVLLHRQRARRLGIAEVQPRVSLVGGFGGNGGVDAWQRGRMYPDGRVGFQCSGRLDMAMTMAIGCDGELSTLGS